MRGAGRFTLRQVVEATTPITNWSRFAVHPVADRVLWVLANHTRLRPNTLTLASLVLGAGAAAAFAQGDRQGLFLGAAAFYVSFALDTIDGPLARLTRSQSRLGAFLDAMNDYFRSLVGSIGLAIGAYRFNGELRTLYLGLVFVAVTLAYYQLGEISTKLLGARPRALVSEKIEGSTSGVAALVRRFGLIPNFGLADFEAIAFVLGPATGNPVVGMAVAVVLGALSRVVLISFVLRRLARADE